MFGNGKNSGSKSKYKIYLIAYKNLDEEANKRLLKHFISFIKGTEDLEAHDMVNPKGSAGLEFRVSLYIKEFKDTIVSYLEKGYSLGVCEMELEYIETQGRILQNLDKEYGEDVMIVSEMEL